MKVLTPGHHYELPNFDEPKVKGQRLQFIHKKSDKKDPTKQCKLISDGTTNEEVLRVLIDRSEFLNKSLPSTETTLALKNLKEALYWFEKRTEDRKQRKVEGTHVE